MLFIVIHQVYELWFKQVLHELGQLEQGFAAGRTAAVLGTFKRILTILKTLVAQVDVLETMTPVEFGSFRLRLESASGFQSQQFRLIEVRLGKRDPRMLAYLQQPGGDAARNSGWNRHWPSPRCTRASCSSWPARESSSVTIPAPP